MISRLNLSSLFSRIFFILFFSLFATLIISNIVWVRYYETRQIETATTMSEELANSMATTVNFFGALPKDYRHIVLQQLRNMGGARFFVSVNDELISIDSINDSELSSKIKQDYSKVLRERLGQKLIDLDVNFASPEKLKVFKNDVMFTELPDRWVQNSLIIEGTPPLLVAQVKLETDEWLYLAALLPDPYFLERKVDLLGGQLLFAILLMLILTVIFWLLTGWVTGPLLKLSRAARQLGKDPLHQVELNPTGTQEIKELANAFNMMQLRMHRFIDDREHLFSAISHDLKTPITRLRLRTELLDNDVLKRKFISDLLELEGLVKGALQYSKGTHSAEPLTPIDIMSLLNEIKEDMALMKAKVKITGNITELYEAKPLALKRCLSNVIENAAFYGKKAHVNVNTVDQEIQINIKDSGKGIPEDQLKNVFKPFTRLEVSRNKNTGGNGLGLSISRNLAHAHGGQLKIRNRKSVV